MYQAVVLVESHIADKSSVLGPALTLTARGKCILSRAKLHLEVCDRAVELQTVMTAEVACLAAKEKALVVTTPDKIDVPAFLDVVQHFTKMAATLQGAEKDAVVQAINDISGEMSPIMQRYLNSFHQGWGLVLQPVLRSHVPLMKFFVGKSPSLSLCWWSPFPR